MIKSLILLAVSFLGLLPQLQSQPLPSGIYKFYAKEYGIQTAGYMILRPDSTSHYWSEDTPNILIEKSEIEYRKDTLVFNTHTMIVGNLGGIRVYNDVIQKFKITKRVSNDHLETIKVEEIENGKVIKLDDPYTLIFKRICEGY